MQIRDLAGKLGVSRPPLAFKMARVFKLLIGEMFEHEENE